MKKLFAVFIAAALSATLMTSCGNKEDTTDIYIPIRTGNTVNYDTAGVYVGTILEQVTLEGTVSSPYTTDLSFTRIGGTIASVEVHNDQEVHEGDVLARLDPTALEDDIVVQELTLNAARSTYENLVAQNADENEIEFAKIAYDIEQYKYDKLVEKREYLELRAPFDGRVITIGGGFGRQYGAGSQIDRYEPFCTISDSSKVCLTVADFGNQLTNVSFGTRVDIQQGAIASATGRVVDTITTDYSTREGSFSVTSYVIQIDDDTQFSDLGGIEVTFTTLRRDDAVIVPTNAVFEATEAFGDSTGATTTYVNVLMNGIKVQTAVSIGVVSGDKTEVLSGLEGGETVILP